MTTKLLKIGLIAMIFTFVFSVSSWAKNEHYRKYHRHFDQIHSYKGVVVIGSIFGPGWGFTFASRG